MGPACICLELLDRNETVIKQVAIASQRYQKDFRDALPTLAELETRKDLINISREVRNGHFWIKEISHSFNFDQNECVNASAYFDACILFRGEENLVFLPWMHEVFALFRLSAVSLGSRLRKNGLFYKLLWS